MKAIVMTGYGAPKDVLELRTDHPKPLRKKGEVLVAVRATSINPGECKVRQGILPKGMIKVPQILGCDVAGEVLETDPTSKFKVGDRVFGCTGQILSDPWGTYAELVSAKEDRLLAIPDGVSFEQAAAMPIAGMTAWQALAPSMPLQGKRVLVHAGAGGIGHFAVQIAKAQGAYVATTCSGRNVEFVTQELGADLAIDYTKDKFEEVAGAPYDLVLDLVGEEPRSWPLLKKNGRMAVISWDKMVEGKSGGGLVFAIVWRIMKMKTSSALGLCPKYDSVAQEYGSGKGLEDLVKLVAAGSVKVHIERVVMLEQIPEAHEYSEQGRTRGKVVVSLQP
ncbi:Reticulon-4-interacting protein 1, mitochondrial [Tetrabaena socialis]|uniref:Reticulon-4-interacting protein 1, mitochondrial n=1 Tax=Tetrabaena socialis TaxID=47790 RepID=A0A2J7ZY71_9CHLO|nr:Reticulon-4-interacting protein 1, mitochondrial [Tetrabaena socialis]|eukprot:PNH05219.1 Reticulon-4-interacting protein 1, mitochondrial [Tetrabaena socialis]